MDILQKFKDLKAVYDYNNQTPQVNAPIEYSTSLIPKESIEQATKDFNTDNYKLSNVLKAKIALDNPLINSFYGGDIEQAQAMYKQLGNDLDKKYGLTGERSLRDTIHNYASSYDIAQRLMPDINKQTLIDAGLYWQGDQNKKEMPSISYIDTLLNGIKYPVLNPNQLKRQQDNVMDFLENKAAIEDVYSSWKDKTKEPPFLSYDEIYKKAEDFSKKQYGLLNKKKK
jgi:hypothetical protein